MNALQWARCCRNTANTTCPHYTYSLVLNRCMIQSIATSYGRLCISTDSQINCTITRKVLSLHLQRQSKPCRSQQSHFDRSVFNPSSSSNQSPIVILGLSFLQPGSNVVSIEFLNQLLATLHLQILLYPAGSPMQPTNPSKFIVITGSRRRRRRRIKRVHVQREVPTKARTPFKPGLIPFGVHR